MFFKELACSSHGVAFTVTKRLYVLDSREKLTSMDKACDMLQRFGLLGILPSISWSLSSVVGGALSVPSLPLHIFHAIAHCRSASILDAVIPSLANASSRKELPLSIASTVSENVETVSSLSCCRIFHIHPTPHCYCLDVTLRHA
jgi:hypothetical protein